MTKRKVKVWVSVSESELKQKQPIAWLHFGKKRPETDADYVTTRVLIALPPKARRGK